MTPLARWRLWLVRLLAVLVDKRDRPRQPAGGVFAGGDVDTEDIAVPHCVDTDDEETGDVHDPSAFADFDRKSVGPHVSVGPPWRGQFLQSVTISSRSLASSET